MRSLKFTKIDYMKNRKQCRFMLFILAIGLFFSRGENNGFLGGLVYTVYIGSIFTSTVFYDFTTHNAGFLLLLPGSVWHRVCGRFLYGIGSEVTLCIAYWLLSAVVKGNLMLPVQTLPICLMVMMFSIIMTDLQFILLYLVGEMKSQYAMSLSRVLFPMIFFAVSFGAMNIIGEEEGEGISLMSAFDWVNDHMALCGILLVGFVAAFTYISIWISAKACYKRDYA